MSETIVVPDNGNNMNNAWPLLAMNGGYGNGIFGGGLGTGFIGGLFGGLLTNWLGIGGNGINGVNGGAAAASLGAQATANNNTDLLMNAITNQGEQSRQAIMTLSTMLGQDFNTVNSAVNGIQTALATVAANQGMNTMQVINAIQSGNSTLASQLCSCCCQMQQQVMQQGYEGQIRTLEQTNSLNTTINANGQRGVDAIADLKASMISEFCAVKEREMQSKIDTQADIIGQLRNAADNAAQTNQILAYINSVFAPLQAQVAAIAGKLPNTVPVVYPNLTVTPASTTTVAGA